MCRILCCICKYTGFSIWKGTGEMVRKTKPHYYKINKNCWSKQLFIFKWMFARMSSSWNINSCMVWSIAPVYIPPLVFGGLLNCIQLVLQSSLLSSSNQPAQPPYSPLHSFNNMSELSESLWLLAAFGNPLMFWFSFAQN